MRHRKRYDQADVIAGIIGGSIGLGVLIAPMVSDSVLGWVGVLTFLSVILVAAWCTWAILAMMFN